MTDSLAEKKKDYMQPVSPETMAHRRDQYATSLRKNKRTQELLDKRRLRDEDTAAPILTGFFMLYPGLGTAALPEKLQLLQQILTTETNLNILESALQLIKQLYTGHEVMPKDLVAFVPLLVQAFANGHFQEIVSFLLCNIASGDHECSQALLTHSAVDLCIAGIQLSSKVAENCVWTLANLAADNDTTRLFLFEKGVFGLVLRLSEAFFDNLQMLDVGLWTLRNLLKSGQAMDSMNVDQLCLLLKRCLKYRVKKGVQIGLWTVHSCSVAGSTWTHALVKHGIAKQVLKLLTNRSAKLVLYAVKALGNIAVASNAEAGYLLTNGLLDRLQPLLVHTDKTVRRNSYWVLSNLAACEKSQIHQLVEHPVASLAMRGLLDDCYYVRKEASFVFSNICILGSAPSLAALYACGVLEWLNQGLDENIDVTILMNILKAVSNLIIVCKAELARIGQASEGVLDTARNIGLVDAIETIQFHVNEDVARAAQSILNKHFELTDIVMS